LRHGGQTPYKDAVIRSLLLCALLVPCFLPVTSLAAIEAVSAGSDLILSLVVLVWLVAAIAAILWGLQARARAAAALAWADRIQTMLAANPQAALVLTPEGGLQAADRLRQWVNLPQKILQLDDLSPTSATGIAEPDYSRLCADIEALRRQALVFDRVVRVITGRVLLAQGRLMTADSRRTGAVVIWFSDVREPLAVGSAQSVEQLSLLQDLDAATAMLEAAPFPIWRRDKSLRLQHVNSAYVRAVDAHNAADVIAQNLELVPPTHAEMARDTKVPVSSDVKTVIDGHQRTLHVHDIDLGEAGVGGFAIDTTLRLEAERELLRHTQAQRETLDMLSAPVAIFGPDQNLIFHNTAFARLFNLPGDWLAEKPGHGDLLERLRDTRQVPEKADFTGWKRKTLSAYTSLLTAEEDMWHLPNDMTLRVVTQPHPQGGLQLLFEDVTPRLVLERSYNTLIQVQQATLNNLHEGAAVIRADGTIRLTNAAFAALWSHDPAWLAEEPRVDQWLEKTAQLFKSKDAQEKLELAIGEIIGARKTITGHLVRSDERTLTYTGIPLPDGSALLTFLDVTDSARIERALRDRNDALVAADKLKTEFMENMSYELRTPLTTIIGFSEMLDKGYFGALTAKQSEYLKGILDSSQQLDGLIADLLDLSGIGSGTLSIARTVVDVTEFMRGFAAGQQQAADTRNITLAVEIGDGLGRAHVDPQRLSQILGKLMDNAFAFTAKGGRVVLTVSGDTDIIQIDVADTGVGIAEQDLPHVFERFRRGSNASTSKGVGLGLALVKHFTELHGGTVTLRSTVAVGTTVRVLIPRRPSADGKSLAA
jgi:signal transduction histidine kinase